MEFRVLGAVEAWSDGVRLDLGSRKQRLLLAILLLEPGRTVPRDRITDLLWPDDPPMSARNTVQTLVSRLRAAFRAHGPQLRSEGAGYVLLVDPEDVDLHRFHRLAARAREADDEKAVLLFDEALALWRGEPLADVAAPETARRLLAGVEEARWTALEDRIDAQLRLGRGRDVLAELTALVAAHPSRQRFVGQLMLTLHRDGRTDDALNAYRALRTRLVEEVGLDPSAELRKLEATILADDGGDGGDGGGAADGGRASKGRGAADRRGEQPVRPAQLPHDVRGFAGRTAELALLDQAGDGCDVRVLTGIAGVGKTALAVRWAHRARHRFPDGQLYLDLRGFDADHEPLRPAVAVTHLLRALGTDPRAIPPDPDEQFALWRSLLADRHVLLVLDNARDSGQVVPLLPPSGTVLVTSRLRLGDLIARCGALSVPVGVLPEEDSHQLLEAVLGGPVPASEAAELARLCGHLPLALRLAAANLGDGDVPGIAELARELAAGDPLTGLCVDGAEESAVTTAFALSYRAVGAEHRRLFRRLSLVPGQTFTAHQAAALADTPVPQANQRLKALAAANLVERYRPGRYRFHDLLRWYAARQVLADERPEDRDTALRRLFEHYLAAADATGRLLIPHFLRLPRDAREVFADADEALAWLDEEWPNVAAAVEHAAEHGPREFAWHIADALRAYFHHRGHRTEWIRVASRGLAAAQSAGEPQPQTAMHLSIALACVNSGRYDEARVHLTTVLREGFADAWPDGLIAVLNNLSAVHQRLGEPREAIRRGLECLRLTEEHPTPPGAVSMALANVGFAYEQIGELDQALVHFTRALELAERGGARFSVAVLLVDLGNVHRDRDDRAAAAEFYERALAANRELGYHYGEAAALSGRALLAAGGDARASGGGDRRATGGGDRRATGGGDARADALEAVRLTHVIGDRGTEAWALVSLGEVCLRSGSPAEATEHFERALTIARETSFTWCETAALAGLAEARLALGDRDRARECADQAAELATRAGYRLLAARVSRIADGAQ
ncbi:AfsR/SARP family transcriptional regulator [Saccharothrix variisporea]|uniref:DNA-binding SARP family transcriptional activator n=1 Tax=Saccharothrix variisporea TaxID=543527 RepID=A0A495X6C4_9PSEU|nr:BTAD domain-containing putative transcriptional regulator [Saccharothrix variisporea]RKT69079.1 DNA-binding SARP family transcriptional activator [Saccharothrix variisporea]